jgi:hypothetical protein
MLERERKIAIRLLISSPADNQSVARKEKGLRLLAPALPSNSLLALECFPNNWN